MSLVLQISDELKAAMKAGLTEKRDTLRLLQSALKNAAIEKRQPLADFTDAAVGQVVKKLVKQRKDSIEQYRAGQREDLAAKEEAELALLLPYLPAMLSDIETVALIDQVIARLGTVGVKDMGRVVGMVMKESAGAADGDSVRVLVSKRLAA